MMLGLLFLALAPQSAYPSAYSLPDSFKLEAVMDWRSPHTPENSRILARRPHRRLSKAEIEASSVPPMVAPVMPWVGRAAWELGTLVDSKDSRLVWSGISEIALRKVTRYEPKLVQLARKGWAPAAFALSGIRTNNVATANELLGAKHRSVRLWAAYTLALASNEAGVAPLSTLLNTEPRKWRRHGGPTGTELARSLLSFSANSTEKLIELQELSRSHRFAQYIAALDTPASRKALVSLALKSGFHDQRKWAIAALASRPAGKKDLQVIAKMADHPDAAASARHALSELAAERRPRLSVNSLEWVATRQE